LRTGQTPNRQTSWVASSGAAWQRWIPCTMDRIHLRDLAFALLWRESAVANRARIGHSNRSGRGGVHGHEDA
jgi:hypothetical protein